MTIETEDVATIIEQLRVIENAEPSSADQMQEAADLIETLLAENQSLSERIDVLREAGNTLAGTVKLIKHVLVANLTKHELQIIMNDLHAWNVASLTEGIAPNVRSV